ncbi:MAG: TRAP transporter substrate-binding protein [Rhodospirillales bacterium]|jgi:TRAP-type mannitol/chloroaromatic compound transport system substrate-binding protein
MKRRSFLKNSVIAGVAGAGAASSFSAPAIAKNRRQLKMVTTWPKNFPGLGTSAERFARRIKEMSNGMVDIKVYAAGELIPALESFDAVSSGSADMYHGSEYYWQGKSMAFNFFTSVPYGLTADEMNAWIYHGGGQKLWDELSAGFNIKAMMACNTGVQMGGWFNKKINTLEDLKGLTIRMPGLGGEVLRRMGATAVTLPGGEIYPSLKSGAIDATEWVGPWNDMAFGFHKVAKYYYYPGFQEPGPAICCGFNLKVWNSLTSDQKAIVKAAAAAENSYTLAEYNAKNAITLEVMKTKHKIKLRKFSDEIMQGIGNASGQVIADAAKSDAMTAKVAKSYLDFRKKMIAWSKTADHAYANARLLPFKYGG